MCRALTLVTADVTGIISLTHLTLAEESTTIKVLNLPERIKSMALGVANQSWARNCSPYFRSVPILPRDETWEA